MLRPAPMRVSGAPLLAAAGALLCLIAQPAPAAPTGGDMGMEEIFGTLAEVYPLSLHADTYADPANRDAIARGLRDLADNARRLAEHGRELSLTFDFLRQTLATDARDAADLFDKGEHEGSRFTLHHLTADCFACHVRLPAPRRVDLGLKLVESAGIRSLPPADRARIEVAARQFDAALATYEDLFRSTGPTALEIYFMGAFEDYLRVSLRVQQDARRPLRTLQEFGRRDDLPRFLVSYLAHWEGSLRALRAWRPGKKDLSRARALIETGQDHQRFPADRQGLVPFVAASGLLNRYIEKGGAPDEDLAEAYYLLGVAESSIARLSWASEAEFCLETAIHLAPSSPHARQAYLLLEEYVIAEYSGSSGLTIPADVARRLEDLRRRVDAP